MPPLWRPQRLHAVDVVDCGDASDEFLATDGFPDAIVREGTKILDERFAGQDRKVIETRAKVWLDRYLNYRFGEAPRSVPTRQTPAPAPAPAPKTWLQKFGPTIAESDPARARLLMQRRRIEWDSTEGVTGVVLHRSDLGLYLPEVRSELRKAPHSIRREWFNRGGRMEIIHTRFSTDHPAWKSFRDEKIGGFASASLCVVNLRGRDNGESLTVLHEFAHGVDAIFDFPSDEIAWQYAAERNRDQNKINSGWLAYVGSEKFLSEYFADQFSRYFHSPQTRDGLSAPVRRYFERFEQRFDCKPLDAVA